MSRKNQSIDYCKARAHVWEQANLCIKAAGTALMKECLGFAKVTQEEKDDFQKTWCESLQKARTKYGPRIVSQILEELGLTVLEVLVPNQRSS